MPCCKLAPLHLFPLFIYLLFLAMEVAIQDTFGACFLVLGVTPGCPADSLFSSQGAGFIGGMIAAMCVENLSPSTKG
jgi:hypothetical protein